MAKIIVVKLSPLINTIWIVKNNKLNLVKYRVIKIQYEVCSYVAGAVNLCMLEWVEDWNRYEGGTSGKGHVLKGVVDGY